ncbi:hypothetical protein [Sphingomonas fuzhouensis]|uniref:hypothetical protein n=1 Tax=Sphingomonas fuzhouensis TaxID=3106033 RepID=UPI002AFE1E2D|nr:hypothetical protein [Sphingomonas sp. SGZ-02]
MATMMLPTGQVVAAGQEKPKTENSGKTGQSGDIVVQGNNDRKAPPPPGINKIITGQSFAMVASRSASFAKCAKNIDAQMLGPLIDGDMNSAPQTYALDRIIRANSSCYSDLPYANAPPQLGECNPVVQAEIVTCRNLYDRGALLEEAMARYAPDATLTEAEVNDPVIQQRLNVREAGRNARRIPTDRLLFQIGICMTRLRPDLVTRLVQAHGDPALQERLTLMVLDKARPCVGNAKKVTMEPVQLRYYLDDAFYRWVVAARDVGTLLHS